MVGGAIILTRPVKIVNDEKNGQDYGSRYVRTGKRTVRVEIDIKDDANASKYFREADQNTQQDVVFPWGDTAAERFTLNANDVGLDQPQLTGNEELIAQLRGEAYASAALDDELSAIFD